MVKNVTLTETEPLFRVIVESMREGAAGISPDGTIIYANQSFCQMLGLLPEDVIGSRFADHVLEEDGSACGALVEESNIGHCGGEIRLVSANGTVVPVLLSFTTVALGEETATCVVATDLTLHLQAGEIIVKQTADQADILTVDGTTRD